MDLESRVKAYAEEARRILLQRALEEKEQKNGKAFWQGYTTNGNGIVKQNGIYKVVKVIGNVALPKNTIVYIDDQNTIETGFKRVLPENRGYDKQSIVPTIADRIKRPLLLFDDLEEENVGDFIITYKSLDGYSNGYRDAAFSEIFGDDVTQGDFEETRDFTAVDRSYIYTPGCNSYGCDWDTGYEIAATTDDVFSVVLAKGTGNWFNFGNFPTIPYLDMTVGSTTKSIQLNSTPYSWDYQSFEIVDFGKRYSTDVSVSWGVNNNGVTWGSSMSYSVSTASLFLANNAKYYYTFGEQSVTRTINLNSIISGDIAVHKRIHDYRTREIVGDNEHVVMYSVFAVVGVDTTQHVQDVINTQHPSGYPDVDIWGGVAGYTPYFVHTKLNLTTGQLQYKTTQASLHSSMNNKSGLYHVNGFIDSYGYSTITNTVYDAFPFGCVAIYHFQQGTGFMNNLTKHSSRFADFWRLVDPAPIFSEAYDGDWISKFTFDDTGYNYSGSGTTAYTYWSRIEAFLELDYYAGTFYRYKNRGLIPYPETGPDCSLDTTDTIRTTQYYGDLPSTLNVSQMQTIRYYGFNVDTYENVLNLTDWIQYDAARFRSSFSASSGQLVRSHKFHGPPFTLNIDQLEIPGCYEVAMRDDVFMHYLSQQNLNYILNDEFLYETVPVLSYRIFNNVAYITTKFPHAFAVNDSVQLNGVGALNGTFTVATVPNNTNFTIAVSSGDVDSTTVSGATATKQ
jgi:hypothetical protein|tara:strand:- start:3523 stop:5724 length:2202 start_codon:yes stop_codon:yes gene_type:complete